MLIMRKLLVFISLAAILALPFLPALATATDLTDSINYLESHYSQQSAAARDWGAMALGSVGQKVTTPALDSTDVLDTARHVLGQAAQDNISPNLVTSIENSYSQDQFGDPDLINDDIFATLAVVANDPVWLKDHQAVFTTISDSQRANGSFGFSRIGDGDTDMTAAAIWALTSASSYPVDPINKAFTYLASSQNNDGGFGYQAGAASNVASSSWVMLAYTALGKDSHKIQNYLISQKQVGGYYLNGNQIDFLNTAYALMALSGQKMPIHFFVKPAVTPSLEPTKTSSPQQPSLKPSVSPKPSTNSQQPAATPSQKKVNSRPAAKKQPSIIDDTPTIACSASASASASASGDNSSASASASASCN